MKTYFQLLGNSLIISITNTFVWFSVSFWAYLETGAVIATSIMSGIFLVSVAVSGFWLGSIVDHHKKKTAMIISNIGTLIFFGAAFVFYTIMRGGSFASITNPAFWIFVILILFGVIAGNIRNIAMPTVTTILVPAEKRDRVNGLLGMVMGLSFAVSSVAAGLGLGFLGLFWILLIGLSLSVIGLIHLSILSIPEKEIIHTAEKPKEVDIKGTIKVIKSIPGLFPLIFFTTFNNFLGGVFMSLMDPYGLSLVSIQVWGTLWGFLSLGFIFGGLYIAKKGLGPTPLKQLFTINTILWIDCILFTIQPSIVLLSIGMIVYICLVPFVEATEQTIIQKVVPVERQGRVFGFAQSIEMAASPVTAFMIGPIAQFIFIPFMTTGKGVELIGSWFGVGPGRGIALVFMAAGVIGLIVTTIARRSKSYKLLGEKYSS